MNVFHDLQLACAGEECGVPRRTARVRVSARGTSIEGEEGLLSRFQIRRPVSSKRSTSGGGPAVVEFALEVKGSVGKAGSSFLSSSLVPDREGPARFERNS